MALNHTCPHCHRPLIEIDHYGERLIGCIECNRWGWRGSEGIFMVMRVGAATLGCGSASHELFL
jgi:hypothetical protein